MAQLAEWSKLRDAMKSGLRSDEWMRVGGLKGYVDGSLGSSTALFYEPYHDEPGTRGIFVTPEDSLRAQIGGADSAGRLA